MVAVIIIVVVVVLLALLLVGSYNGIVRMRNQVDNGWSQIVSRRSRGTRRTSRELLKPSLPPATRQFRQILRPKQLPPRPPWLRPSARSLRLLRRTRISKPMRISDNCNLKSRQRKIESPTRDSFITTLSLGTTTRSTHFRAWLFPRSGVSLIVNCSKPMKQIAQFRRLSSETHFSRSLDRGF